MRQIFCLFMVFLFSATAMAEARADATPSQKPDVYGWSTLPILHEGRIKPIDSFARVMLKKFSGSEKLRGLEAKEWLAYSVFEPAEAINLPVFKIRNFEAYNLEENDKRLYSYADLSQIIDQNNEIIKALMKTDQEDWNPDQTYLMQNYEHYILYTQILRSLTLLLPLGGADSDGNFLDYKKIQQDIDDRTQKIVQKKGVDLETYTKEEREISFLSYQLRVLEQGAGRNVLFRIMPAKWEDKKSNWVSPWAVIQQGKGSPKSAEYMSIWQDMAGAYREGNTDNFKKYTARANDFFNKPKLELEKIYNILNLKQVSLLIYCLSLLLMVIANFYWGRSKNIIEKINKVALGLLIAGIVSHTLHIILRVIILERPPVGTLYESILFVCLICVMGFALMAIKQKNNFGILLGALSGVILLTTAHGFTGDDTMSTLVAVLNTNFWLATHVLCITIGYATCLIASLMAHYDLGVRWVRPDKTEFLKQNSKNLKTVLILSLLFTTVGTILGGIWADQSWGRFWGWDPKENGALLIVLWLAWLLHGRISGHINQIGVVVGSAFLSIIVVLAWFGVNLLNIGLHSYGFISGVATGITVFCIFETILILCLWALGRRKAYAL